MTETVRRSPLGMSLPSSLGVGALAVAFYSVFYALSVTFGLEEFLRSVGVRPLTLEGIKGTVFYSLGHTSLNHLIVNMVPLLILTTFICYLSGWRLWLGVTALIAVFSGWFCFFVGSPDTLIVGASGITSGLGAYLFLSAPFRRALFAMVIGGVFTGVSFVSLASTVTVGGNATSWQAHAGGLLAGTIIACILHIVGEWGDKKESLPEHPVGTPYER